ncbi:MAG: outer membrane protein assembly factor BamB [Aestuariibacter sp.]
MLSRAAAMAALLSLSGCSAIPEWMNPGTWFEDEEELAIKELKPINATFSAKKVWDGEVGSGVEYYFSRLSPAFGYGKVFAASRQGLIVAFDKTSGKRVWTLDLAEYRDEGMLSGVSSLWSDGISAKVSGGLAVSYSSVYLGTENGVVMAIDADSGDIKWQTKVKGEVLAQPAVDEGLVVVNTGSGILYALDAETGEQRWIYESEVPALTLRGIANPTISSGGAIVGTASGKVAVNIVDSGQTLWEQTVAAATGATELERLVDIDSQTIVFGGVIYVVSFNGTLAAMDLRTGRIIWKREYRSYRRMSLAGNTLFVVDDKSQVYALDRRNGVELWAQVGLRGRDLTAAVSMQDYVVVGDKFGYLHWLDQSSGDIVARYQFGDDDEDEGVYVAPVVDGDTLYSVTRDGQIIALQIP